MSQGCRLRHDPFRKPTLPLPSLLQLVPSLIGSFGSATYRSAIIQRMINTEAHIHLTKLAYKHRYPNIHGAACMTPTEKAECMNNCVGVGGSTAHASHESSLLVRQICFVASCC